MPSRVKGPGNIISNLEQKVLFETRIVDQRVYKVVAQLIVFSQKMMSWERHLPQTNTSPY